MGNGNRIRNGAYPGSGRPKGSKNKKTTELATIKVIINNLDIKQISSDRLKKMITHPIEIDVIALFAELNQILNLGWVILSGHGDYPDFKLKRNGKIYRTEFEGSSKHFFQHRHDPKKSDLIICFKHDWKGCPIPVISLLDILLEYALNKKSFKYFLEEEKK